jgi:hypothetical protein
VQVDLGDDRFDVTYDGEMTSVDDLLASIQKLEFEPVVVEHEVGSKADVVTKIDVAALPDDLRDLFAEAGKAAKPVLIRFSGPG